ncbi:MAG: hypothetical protein H6Q70_3852 [Firmicutes bacterium]|nr:hypothetical protein [Bacillota bacterium]
MVELKDRMSKHVKAAKTWLVRAEQSFDKEQNIRGELDLMLAQAELKRAQESKIKDKTTYDKYRLIRSILAAGVAGLVVVVGFSGWGFLDKEPASSAIGHINKVEQSKQTALIEMPNTSIHGQDQEIVEKKAVAPIVDQEVTQEKQENKVETKGEKKIITSSPAKEDVLNLPPAQLQNLMRAAGKSLRGQE